jgi:hypothetical protein
MHKYTEPETGKLLDFIPTNLGYFNFCAITSRQRLNRTIGTWSLSLYIDIKVSP